MSDCKMLVGRSSAGKDSRVVWGTRLRMELREVGFSRYGFNSEVISRKRAGDISPRENS